MNWNRIVSIMQKGVYGAELPSVSQIAVERRDPFRVLISTMISLRTKDEVTLEASNSLFALADTPEKIITLSVDEIARTIYPAGFYKTKAVHIRETAHIIIDKHHGKVPDSMEELLVFPGVGRKTANLVLNLGFGIDAICVDTHVHRISNRMGAVSTKNPEETEFALMKILPKKYWIQINELLVLYGQKICTPQSPRCTICMLQEDCPRIGVERFR